MLRGLKQACLLQVVISVVRDEAMSPPILKGTKIVVVVISNRITHHESFEINYWILNALVLFIDELG